MTSSVISCPLWVVVDLIRLKELHGVLLGRLVAHGDPGVGIEHIGVDAGLLRVMGCDYLAAVLLRDLGGPPHDLRVGHPDGGAACDHVNAHDGTGIQERVADVVAVSEVDELLPAEPAQLLLDGDHVRQGLAGVLQVVEPADDGDGRILPELVHHLVVERTVHDAVDEAAHDTGRVLDGLAVDPHLHLGLVDVERMASELRDGDVERDPRTGAGLLEDHREGLALEGVAVVTALSLELDGEVDHLWPLVLHVRNRNQVSLCHGWS